MHNKLPLLFLFIFVFTNIFSGKYEIKIENHIRNTVKELPDNEKRINYDINSDIDRYINYEIGDWSMEYRSISNRKKEIYDLFTADKVLYFLKLKIAEATINDLYGDIEVDLYEKTEGGSYKKIEGDLYGDIEVDLYEKNECKVYFCENPTEVFYEKIEGSLRRKTGRYYKMTFQEVFWLYPQIQALVNNRLEELGESFRYNLLEEKREKKWFNFSSKKIKKNLDSNGFITWLEDKNLNYLEEDDESQEKEYIGLKELFEEEWSKELKKWREEEKTERIEPINKLNSIFWGKATSWAENKNWQNEELQENKDNFVNNTVIKKIKNNLDFNPFISWIKNKDCENSEEEDEEVKQCGEKEKAKQIKRGFTSLGNTVKEKITFNNVIYYLRKVQIDDPVTLREQPFKRLITSLKTRFKNIVIVKSLLRWTNKFLLMIKLIN